MYKHLLVPTDGTKLSGKAVDHAIALARAIGARVTAFHATAKPSLPAYFEGAIYDPGSDRQYAAWAKREADRILGGVVKKAAASGVQCDTIHAVAEAPWEEILASAKKKKCDAIVMASHGRRGLSALVLGSEAQKVLTHGKFPVLIVR